MGMAEELWQAFLRENPAAAEGKLSLEEMNRRMKEFQQRRNEAELDDFDSLSPAQMQKILYSPLENGCLLQLRPTFGEHAGEVPLFRLSELLLDLVIEAGAVKLTTIGHLPVKICERLYHENSIDWPYRKYIGAIREEKIPYIAPLKFYLLDQGILKKRKGTLSITQAGEAFLTESPGTRFKKLFDFFTRRYHWANFYDSPEGDDKCGQLGWAFSVLLLLRYGGDRRQSAFYSDWNLRAFHQELYRQRERAGSYLYTFDARFFENFSAWFGLVNLEWEKGAGPSVFGRLWVTKTALLDKLFVAGQ